MFFSRRFIYAIAAALTLAAVAEARCGNSGLPDDCPPAKLLRILGIWMLCLRFGQLLDIRWNPIALTDEAQARRAED
ncbi:hypothetical protein C8R46DRAFT_1352056 [Mycena filopes]|nr:hypothetical protein C8R46DRAFT_1352056 [Mycena filopes]